MTGAAWAGVLLLLLPHGKEGSYDRSDLKKKEPLGVFSVISVGFVQLPACLTLLPDTVCEHSRS